MLIQAIFFLAVKERQTSIEAEWCFPVNCHFIWISVDIKGNNSCK